MYMASSENEMSQEIQEEAATKKFHWSEIEASGNKYGFLPEAAMLLDGGMEVIRYIKLKGEKKSELITVIYDESYVIEWLRRNLTNKLKGMPWNELQRLVSTAYKLDKVK